MSPRRSSTEAGRTRAAILARGVAVASVEGLEGLTIGRLATDLGLSKSGLLGHFGSKESLQLAVVDTAAEIFFRETADHAIGAAPGLPRLRAMCEAWISHLEREVFPGGCFFTAAASEYDDRNGPVRDAVAGLVGLWERDLRLHVRLAVETGDLPAGTDPDQVVFELVGQMLALNHTLRLHRDRGGFARARRAMARLLGQPEATIAAPSPDAAHPGRTPVASA
ncbi:TetR/AcrR family transcriptional regulator [Micromonospora sp. NBC_01796]|uniref:TetR/AcrR family transcriptional regulator n=1 Tax=Micromonospora sp. NBC_01796 TaxID=2975987 RepID=UPI002DDC7B7E|nr:TetR/AcrR family transcriptional regulator [Micromonospora sp. NBC_01796]WSA82755.1 TetR/AcrR family transcriptional regulator [Micromonospora sp. NBC_01796]